ncbi:MAG: hypothetical protein J5486_08795 [Bacteroidaceae bacterium]|nr:hypothetical protein [Bacteroidaceae bacterium]
MTASSSLCDSSPAEALSMLETIKDSVLQSSEYTRMLWSLLYIKAQDKMDYIFTTDSIIRPVAMYFEEHGTPNEAVEALFRLGRVYTEMHFYPQAVSAYLKCIDYSEKNAYPNNSTYLYACSQLDGIYVEQNNYKDALMVARKAYSHAYNCGLVNPTYIMDVATPFAHLGLKDSADHYNMMAFNEIVRTHSEAQYSSIITELLDYYSFHQNQAKASLFLKTLDSIPTSLRDNSYYVAKASYYVAFGPADSALYYNNYALSDSSNIKLRKAAAQGLMLTYYKLGEYEKACQYSLVFAQAVQTLVSQMQIEKTNYAVNEYSNHKRIEAEAKAERNAMELKITVVVAVCFVVVVILCFVIVYISHKRKTEHQQKQLIEELLESQEQKRKLTMELSYASMSDDDERLINRFKNVGALKMNEKPITNHEWNSIMKLPYPTFVDEMTREWPEIGLEERRIAVLIKLGFTSTEIKNITGLSRTTIYRRKKGILERLDKYLS